MAGDLEHAPANVPGSPRHPDGRVRGFKALGFYFGDVNWVRERLHSKAVKLYSPLDRVDEMGDSEDVENSAQICYNIIDHTANGMPSHWLRGQSPDETTVPPRDINGAPGPDGKLPPLLDSHGLAINSMTGFIDQRTAQTTVV